MQQDQKIVLTPRKFISTLSRLHLSFTIAPLIFASVVFYTTPDIHMDYMETDNPFFHVVPVISILGIALGKFLYSKKKIELSKKNTLKEKFAILQQASIIKSASIEGPALIGLVGFMKSGNLLYMVIAGVLIVYLISERPTKSGIEQDLQLNLEQQGQFNQMDTEI